MDAFSFGFKDSFRDFKEHVQTAMSTFCLLRSFYSSPKIKRWKSQRKKGSRSEEDRAIQAIINTTKGDVHAHHSSEDPAELSKRTPILAIGDGQFKGLKNVVDKSNGLRNRLVAK
ncbi:hypothetical protein DFQ26_003097, partial [Actinomortierella ambigua]